MNPRRARAAVVVQVLVALWSALLMYFYREMASDMSYPYDSDRPNAYLAAACGIPPVCGLGLSLPLALGKPFAVRASRLLALWYPVGPLVAMIWGPAFHGSITLIMVSLFGLIAAILIRALTRPLAAPPKDAG
jgi:hypothetical protein